MTDLEIAKRLVRTEQSARHREKEFGMSFKRMKELLNTKTCYITGVPLQLDDDKAEDYLTLERLDNNEGYVDNNVVACSSYMNKKKGDLTKEEIIMMHKALKKKGII